MGTTKKFRTMAEKAGPPPAGPLAVPGNYKFVPEECTTEYLIGLLDDRNDSLNDDPAVVAQEKEAAKAELHRRRLERHAKDVPKK